MTVVGAAAVNGSSSLFLSRNVLRFRLVFKTMPTISEFFGIMILMFYDDHAPPHFHARYGDDEVVVQIDPVGVLRGKLPPRALSMVIEWAVKYQAN